jgi:trehalose 6-phosphate phosphatase
LTSFSYSGLIGSRHRHPIDPRIFKLRMHQMAERRPPAEIERRIMDLRRLAGRAGILLDFDGTLSDIVLRPELARAHEGVEHELARLAATYAVVAAISGRPTDDLERLIGVPGVRCVGLYGLEEASAIGVEILRAVETLASSFPGAWVERKGATATVHVREAPDPDAATAELAGPLRELAAGHGLEIIHGKRALEVVPAGNARKGGAVERIVGEHGLAAALYAGDDVADAEAFAALDALEEAGGTAIRVAVLGAETPEALVAGSDLSVDGPAGLVELLRTL